MKQLKLDEKYSKFYILFPKYQKIVRPGESNNNRPVYEPWLIWGVLKFLWLHRSEEEDDYGIPVFDLSPNWSY